MSESGAACAEIRDCSAAAQHPTASSLTAPQGELFRICDQHHLPRESERRKQPRHAPPLTETQYNSCIIEDKNSNGMVEALILWQSIINSHCENPQLLNLSEN